MSERYKKLIEEKERLEKQIIARQNQIHQKEQSENYRKRKVRTRTLIQKGALLEKYFNIPDYSIEDTEKILSFFAPYVADNMPERFRRKNTPM